MVWYENFKAVSHLVSGGNNEGKITLRTVQHIASLTQTQAMKDFGSLEVVIRDSARPQYSRCFSQKFYSVIFILPRSDVIGL